MKNRILIMLPICLLLLGGCKTEKITREDTEWSDFWWSHEPDTSKPRVLFIGNSISMEPELEKYSGSKGDVHYNKEGYNRLAEQISNEILKLTGK